jgi:hypothetical protein
LREVATAREPSPASRPIGDSPSDDDGEPAALIFW